MNYIEAALEKETQFINNINDATDALFSQSETLHSDESNNRIIKACIDQEHRKIYIFDLHNDIMSVFFENLMDWEEGATIKDMLYWKHNIFSKNPHASMNFSLVFSNKSSDFVQLNRDKFFIADLALEKFADIKKELAKIFGEEILSQKPNVNISCADYVGTLKSYYDFLQSKNLFNTKYNSDFFYKLNQETNNVTDEYIYNLKDNLSSIFSYLQTNHNLDTEYHHIKLNEENIVIQVESGAYFIKIEDENNYTVYISKEYEEIDEFMQRINDDSYNEENELKDVILKVENGQTSYSYLPLVKEAFKIDLQFIVDEIDSQNKKSKNKP